MTSPVYFNVLDGKRLNLAPDVLWTVGDGSETTMIVGPAFFDPQVNGFAGVDFQNPDISMDELEYALAKIQKAGCSHILLTLITAGIDTLIHQFRRLASVLEESERIRKMVLGFHLEGPFISPKPGFRGAHPPEHTSVPDWSIFAKLQEASGGRIRLVTVAPELDGSLPFIEKAARNGILVSVGHTDASYDQLLSAVQVGARMMTHLGNGCPIQLHRHDNIIQRVLAIPDLLASLIPDGIHLPPYVLANLARSLGTARVVMTTDAMSAAGAPPGKYTLGKLQLEVGEDRVVRMPGGKNFAGSSLTMAEGFLNCVRFGGFDVQSAWHAWTRLREVLFPGIAPPWLGVPFPPETLDQSI
jgi:N-acetylglucosamine-6-phosphate deacetylase